VLDHRKDAVKWLVARGAHLGIQEGGNPLNNAAWSGNQSMVILLLELNADPNLLGSYVSHTQSSDTSCNSLIPSLRKGENPMKLRSLLQS